MDFEIKENALTAKAFIALQESAGFGSALEKQMEKGLANSIFTIAVMDKELTVGMGRLVGDGANIWYIQNVVVLPEYQGKGIGMAIMERLILYIEENSLPGTETSVGLMAAKGKEDFYRKFGFRVRPNEKEGAGMMMNIKILHKDD